MFLAQAYRTDVKPTERMVHCLISINPSFKQQQVNLALFPSLHICTGFEMYLSKLTINPATVITQHSIPFGKQFSHSSLRVQLLYLTMSGRLDSPMSNFYQ